MPTSDPVDFDYLDNIEVCILYHLEFMTLYGQGGWNDPTMRRHKEAFRALMRLRREYKRSLGKAIDLDAVSQFDAHKVIGQITNIEETDDGLVVHYRLNRREQ